MGAPTLLLVLRPLLLLVLLARSGAAQGVLEDSVWRALPPGPPIERLGVLLDTLTTLGRDPGWVGVAFNPDTDPDVLRPTFYAVRPDSTVWIRPPDGASVVLDLFVATTIGTVAGAESGYGAAPAEGLGYGVRGGRLYIYASQGVDVSFAIVAGLLGVVAMGGTIAGLARSLRRSRERERDVVASRRRLADARETERLRIARDIHDGPVQDLHAVRLRLDRVASADDTAPVSEAVLSVIDGLRTISENLRPPALATMGVRASIESFLGQIEAAHPALRLDFEAAGPPPRLSDAAGLAVFRVVQEAVNNAARHAAPSSIAVRATTDATTFRVTVADDGSGFDVASGYAADGHYGLVGMAERAESVGGRAEVASRPGAGTRVTLTVPQDPVQTD